MRAVLDTNVYISAFIKPTGPAGQIIDRWRDGAFINVLSSAIIVELEGVLQRKRILPHLRRSPEWIASYLLELRNSDAFVEPTELDVITEDPPDNLILGTAVAGAADYLVSGNDHLLTLGVFQGIEIVPPRRFLFILDHLS